MLSLIKKYSKNTIYAINYGKNAGKGHAVMTGMKYTKGNYILMLDADGATETSDYEKLRRELDQIKTEDENLGITIGSRAHLQSADAVKIEVNFI
jgi:dolichyl-phosphate beta-glucosyltransferase